MTQGRRGTWWVGVLAGWLPLAAACGGSTGSEAGADAPSASVGQTIVNGTVTSRDVHVGYFDIGCTGTVVAPNAVVYAAHCNHANVFYRDGLSYPVKYSVLHPQYGVTPAGGSLASYDLAVAVLSTHITGIAYGRLATRPPQMGATVWMEGFGCTGPNSNEFGTHRYGTNIIGRIGEDFDPNRTESDDRLRLTFGWNTAGMSTTCPGDSGGPAFLAEGDVSVLAGVHSLTDSVSLGYATRVDPHVETRAWLDSQLEAAHELIAPSSAYPCGEVQTGRWLRTYDTVKSCNGMATLKHQSDGNVVLYLNDGRPLWSTQTNGHQTQRFTMQPDGNAVVYNVRNQLLWQSGTAGLSGARMVLQDDCNLVIYDSTHTPRWSSNTTCDCGVMRPGRALARGQGIRSCNGKATLLHQADGNVVELQNGVPLWSTNTAGHSTSQLVMQGDGNLVLYSTTGQALWHTYTSGNSGSILALQDDCNLAIYAPGHRPIWSTGRTCR